jgi:hypothetical protein
MIKHLANCTLIIHHVTVAFESMKNETEGEMKNAAKTPQFTRHSYRTMRTL